MSAVMLQIKCREPVQSNIAVNKQLWPWIKAQTIAGNPVTVSACLTEDAKTDAQRSYYHGVILLQISHQAKPNGVKFPLSVWKEHFRKEYLGFRTVTCIDPMTGKKSRRRVRKSTEDLGVRAYSNLIDKVTAFAVTELSVEFTVRSFEAWEAMQVDPDTGEILNMEHA